MSKRFLQSLISAGLLFFTQNHQIPSALPQRENKVRLSALNLEFYAPTNFVYSFEGRVPDVGNRLLELNQKYGLPLDFGFTDNTPAEGYTYSVWDKKYDSFLDSLTNGGYVVSHVFLSSKLKGEEYLFARGHEETHTLIDFNKLGLLKDALERQGINSYNLENEHKEVICNVGGFYSLLLLNPKAQEIEIPKQGYREYLPRTLDWLVENNKERFNHSLSSTNN